MAVITDAESAATILELQTRVRRAVGDTESAAANQRWTDAEINDAINLELQAMSAEWGLGNSGAALTSATLTYTGGSYSTVLPAGPDVNPIFMVEDITDSSHPIRLEFSSILDADTLDIEGAYSGSRGRRWSRVGSAIAIRPKVDSSISLRIWYLRAPYAFTLDGSGDETDNTDQQPWPVQHEELVSLGAALRLQEVDGEIPSGRVERYASLWQRFVRSKYANKGPIYVRRNRRYR